MHFGISDVQLFFPQNYLDFKMLVDERAKKEPVWREKLEKALKATGQKSLRFPYKDQDSVVLATEAFSRLLEKNSRDLKHFRVFLGGTETGVDHSKSITSYVGEALATAGIELPSTHASFQTQHACAGGMYGVFTGLALLQASIPVNKLQQTREVVEWGAVIASDISRYDAPSTAEITQGAGAVAVLIEENPKLLRVDMTAIGYSSMGVDDFFRPLGSLTAKVKGRYSIECFNTAFRQAFLNFCERKDDYPEVVLASAHMVVLHTPYANMPATALRPLLEEYFSKDASEIEAYLESRYLYSSTKIASEVGNLYTGAIFASLVGGLKAMYKELGSEMIGKRILVASYGSGNTMAVTEMVVTPTAPSIVEKWDVDSMLASKASASWAEYLAWLEQEGSLLAESAGTGFYLKEIREDGYRIYDRKIK